MIDKGTRGIFNIKVAPSVQQFFPAILSLLIIAQTFSVAIESKMHQRIPETLDYYARCISAAISSLKYNLNGYVGYEKIYKNLIENGFAWENHENPTILNNSIQKALTTGDAGSNVIFMSDDVGYVDYFRIAFALFGYTLQSFLYLYFFLLLIQVAIFFIEFRKDNLAILGLNIFLLSHYIMVSGLSDAGYNLWAVHNNRFLPVLGVLPLAHICLLAIFKKSLKMNTFLVACIQSLMFVFIIQLRSSAIWMLGPMFTIAGIAAISLCIRRSFLSNACKGRLAVLTNIRIKLWPVLIVMVMIFLSTFIRPYILNHGYYKEENFISHPIWYPVYIGLAISPEIREIYGPRLETKAFDIEERFSVVCNETHGEDSLRKKQARKWLCSHPKIAKQGFAALNKWRQGLLNYTQMDQDGHRATLKWLRENGKTEEHLYNFGPGDKVGYPRWFGQCDSKEKYLQNEITYAKWRKFDNTKDFKWREMDKIMGQVVKDAVKNHPILVLKVIFITKPFFFLLYYIFYFAKIRSLSALILIIATNMFLLFWIRKSSLVEMQRFLTILFGIFAFSMIVPMGAYPSPHTISEQALLLTMCIWGLILYLLNKKWNSNFNNSQLDAHDEES